MPRELSGTQRGRTIDAGEAERFGILVRVWLAARWEQELESFIQAVATGPTKTYACWKLSINHSMLMELDAYTDYERWANTALGETDDRKDGIQAFREKRKPRVRRPLTNLTPFLWHSGMMTALRNA